MFRKCAVVALSLLIGLSAVVSFSSEAPKDKSAEIFRCEFNGPYQRSGENGKDTFPENCSNNYAWGKKDITLKIFSDESGNDTQVADIHSISSGAFQFFVQGFSVWRTNYYRVSFRMKAENFGGNVSAVIRKIQYPWTEYVKGITFFPTTEWKTYSFSGISSGDADSDFGVMISTGSTGRLWFDDVIVERFKTDPDAEKIIRKPVSGNLFPRSSFEGESDYFWCSTTYPKKNKPDGFMEDPQIYRTEDGKFGTHCLAFPSAENPSDVCMRSYQVPVCPGESYRFSFWAKNPNPNAQLRAGIIGSGINKTIASKSFETSPLWQRYELPVKIPEHITDAYVSMSSKEQQGTFLLDGFSFRLASDKVTGEYEPARPYELCVSTPQVRGNLFRWGEKIPLILSCYPASNATANEPLHAKLRVTGYPDSLLHESDVELECNMSIKTELDSAYNGILRIELVPKDSSKAAPSEIIAALLPEPRCVGENSFFGSHITINPYFMNYAKQIGIKWIRLHDAGILAKWSVSEPVQNEFCWYDRQVDALKQHGFFILGLPDDSGLPKWAVDENSTNAVIAKADAFRKHCKALASHYAGKIDHWEVWNEPYMNYFFKGTPEQFRAIGLAGSQGIHEGNPNAMTLGICSEIGGLDFVEKVGPAIWNDLNAISFHMYFSNITGNGKFTFADELNSLRATIGANAPAQAWNTEGTLGSAGKNSFYSFLGVDPKLNDMAVAFSSRMWLESAKSGIAKTFIYTMHQSDTFMYYGGLKMLIGFDRSITPAAAAMAVCAWCIDGLTITPCPEIDGLRQAYFTGEDRNVWVAYGDPSEESEHTLNIAALPHEYQVLDVMGNSLRNKDQTEDKIHIGVNPVYVLAPSSTDDLVTTCQNAITQD